MDITITIGERKIPLQFTMREFALMEEEIGNMGEIQELLLKGKKRIRNTVSAIRILGNAGLKKNGESADLTDEWLLDSMDPKALMAYQLAVVGCLSKASESEAVAENNESNERDLVLEEINAKKDPVNSHSGG